MRNSDITIFSYSDFRDYLRDRGTGIGRGKQLSNARWARYLGYASPRTVGMVLEGRRVPSQEMVERFQKLFRHTEREHRYFELMIAMQKFSTAPSERSNIQHQMQKLRPVDLNRTVLSETQIHHIIHWYSLAIKQLVASPNFVPDFKAISKRLRNKVQPKQVEEALEHMVAIGVLERTTPARGYRVAQKQIMSTSDIPSATIRQHHIQQMNRAKEALREQPLSNREFYAITLKVHPSRIPEAKEYIREMMDGFERRFHNDDSEAVYQLNTQFFSHTMENFT